MVTVAPNDTVLAHLCATDEITEVCNGIYLSGYDVLSDEKIIALNISLIINATLEKPNFDIPNVDVVKLAILDLPTENIRAHMDVCADRIDVVKRAGGRALIHCALGISRSVTIALAYLIKYEHQTLREAYFEVKKRRPRIRPNDGFWRQLISFESDTNGGKTTVKMLLYPGGSIANVYSVGGGNNVRNGAFPSAFPASRFVAR